jgi:hypothetical protein
MRMFSGRADLGLAGVGHEPELGGEHDLVTGDP